MNTMNMPRLTSMPGFTAEASLYSSEDEYEGVQQDGVLPLGGGVILARISRCGAACKCCSSDGNGHCCDVCDRCVP
jgi:hypothetical protein